MTCPHRRSERREAGIPLSGQHEKQAEPTAGEAKPESTRYQGPSGPAPKAPRAENTVPGLRPGGPYDRPLEKGAGCSSSR
jgi:hypothetical protein